MPASKSSYAPTNFFFIRALRRPDVTWSCRAMGINISESSTVKGLLDRHPYLLHTFVDLGLMCVGCPAGAFHDLADVAKEYNLDRNKLVARLKKVIDDVTPGNRPRKAGARAVALSLKRQVKCSTPP
jgi:hybrid cluster-associated redox disulfide protein